MWLSLVILFFLATCNRRAFSESRLPQFTELDDYDKCLSVKNAFYCFGKFRILANGSDQAYFDFIKEYSEKSHNFDRTVFHRGYCVSSRCPHHTNTVDGFQRCVHDSHPGLNITLHTLYSCETELTTRPLDFTSFCFLCVISVLVILNIIGTLYNANGHGIENNFWTSWSVRSNWQQLVEPFGNDPDTAALAPIQGIRVFLMAIIIIIHVFTLYSGSFIHNPSYIEKMILNPSTAVIMKNVSIVQIFLALSVFFSSYNLLQISKKHRLDLGSLPKQIMKRYLRIAPVHLLLVGFNATLFTHISNGPLWSGRIYLESEMCRKRFWYHVFNINNFVEPLQFCIPQSWSLAVDMQFHIISLLSTIILSKYFKDKSKIKIFAICLVCSCLFNMCCAYILSWKPFLLEVTGKTAVNLGMDLDTWARYYYVSPSGSASSCFVGLLMAQVYYNWKQQGSKLSDYQGLSYLCRYALPLFLIWIAAGQYTLQNKMESRLLLAIYLMLERPVYSGLTCLWIFGLITSTEESRVKRFLSWRGWLPLGRLSLSVLMLHWLVTMTHLHYQPQPYYLSHKSVLMDVLSCWCLSYIIAVPVTILVELPIINTYNYFSKKQLTEKTKQETIGDKKET